MTPARERQATFLPPYLISGQALAVDTGRLPHVHSVDDLDGLTIGVQRGNTSERIAERLVADGKAARVRVYDYGDIGTALTDLTTGGCDAVLKLAPVLSELVKPLPGVEVVQRGLSVENIAIAVAAADQALAGKAAGGSGRAGGGRHAAAHSPQMVGQPLRRPESRGAVTPVGAGRAQRQA